MMARNQRIVTTILWGLAVLGMLGVVGTGLWAKKSTQARELGQGAVVLVSGALDAGEGAELPEYFDAPSFSLTDQNERTVTEKSLRGNVWVAMLFFTQCTEICPGMVARLVDLQETVTDPKVKLVSFTLDPERDTPKQLKQYSEQLGADSERWCLLTGTQDEMFAAAEGLKLAASPASGDKPISHTGKMLLIDQRGKVRGVYDSADDESMKKLAADAQALAAAPVEKRQ